MWEKTSIQIFILMTTKLCLHVVKQHLQNINVCFPTCVVFDSCFISITPSIKQTQRSCYSSAVALYIHRRMGNNLYICRKSNNVTVGVGSETGCTKNSSNWVSIYKLRLEQSDRYFTFGYYFRAKNLIRYLPKTRTQCGATMPYWIRAYLNEYYKKIQLLSVSRLIKLIT